MHGCIGVHQKIFTSKLVHKMPDSADSEPKPDTLRLDHFLKTNSISETGGQAKQLIQNSEVKVNGKVETRRRRQLVVSDVIEVAGKKFVVKKT